VDLSSLEDGGPEGIRDFLTQALEDGRDLLPDWWTEKKIDECIAFGRHNSAHSFTTMAEKSDVVEYYGNPMMPMQLRMFAEQVLHEGPGGQSGATMMQMMMAQEAGTGPRHMNLMSMA
jgi:mitochondrial splicing suppressor protein 51